MDVPNSPVMFYSPFNVWHSWVRTISYDLITLISDLFFVSAFIRTSADNTQNLMPQVYRAWVVWNKNYLICVIPFSLFLADIGVCSESLEKPLHYNDVDSNGYLCMVVSSP